MRFFWMTATAAATLAIGSAAQSNPSGAPSAKTQAPKVAPAGKQATASSVTEVLAELTRSVNAKKVQAGDAIKAAVTQDVLIHGKIFIPRGSKLVGHITQARIRTQNNGESAVGLIFDKALLRGGGEINFNGTISALAAPPPLDLDDGPDPMATPGKFVRGQTGGLQQAQPAINSGARGRGLPSTDEELNAAASANASAAEMNKGPRYGNGDKSAAGLMSAGSRGVFGLPGLRLQNDSTIGRGSVITSINRNVKLENGTQILIQANIRAE